MRLINPRVVDFSDVLQGYSEIHRNSDKYVLDVLGKADKHFLNWIETQIFISDVGEIIIPYHIGEGSEKVIVSKNGEKLGEVYQKLLVDGRKNYQEQVPSCFEKVMLQKELIMGGKVNNFLFSQGPFYELDETYKFIKDGEGQITHLDGLHRLLAIMDLSPEKKPLIINSFIAMRRKF